MNCTACGQPYGEGDVFCGTCGADLGLQRADAPITAQPPTFSATPPPPPEPPPFPTAQPVAAPPPPATPSSGNSKTLWIVLSILAGLLFLCLVCSGGGYLLWKRSPFNPAPASQTPPVEKPSEPSAPNQPTPTQESPPANTADTPKPVTYETPDAAMNQVLPTGWVLRKAHEGPQQVEFWGGPPNSEFTTVYLVNAQPEGGWLMTESYPLEVVGEGP